MHTLVTFFLRLPWAIRLSKAFGTTAESWLNQQMQYDLWQAEQAAGNIDVKPLFVA